METLEPERLERLPAFKRRLEWFIDHRPDLSASVASMDAPGRGDQRIAAAARDAAQTMDELVWAVNARNDTVEGFASYVSQFAEEHIAE